MEVDLFYISEKRVKLSLEHREPDRIPFDLGATSVTGIHRYAYLRLREYLGLPVNNCELYTEISQVTRLDQDVIEKLGIDVDAVTSAAPARLNPVPQNEGNYLYLEDDWGIVWRMHAENGIYFDLSVSPLTAAESVKEIERYPWPDPEEPRRFKGLKETTQAIRNKEHRACVMRSPCAGIWEMGLWLCGFEKFAHAVLDKITELKMRYWSSVLKVVVWRFLDRGRSG